jgi:hypothetical protein
MPGAEADEQVRDDVGFEDGVEIDHGGAGQR